MFILDPQLRKDTLFVGELPLSLVLLMNDRTYPWFILVPRRPDIREIFELSDQDQGQLLRESTQLARILSEICRPDKMNIAALGNMVPQLHLHHIVRYRTDPAWPAPVWGKTPAVPYSPHEAETFVWKITSRLTDFSPTPTP